MWKQLFEQVIHRQLHSAILTTDLFVCNVGDWFKDDELWTVFDNCDGYNTNRKVRFEVEAMGNISYCNIEVCRINEGLAIALAINILNKIIK